LFEAFGTNVPDEIALLLNLDEINLQYQLDAPFLLSVSPGQVAQHFNAIAKLDQIDRGLFNINKAVRELESENKYKKTDLENKEIELSKYDHLEKFEIDVETLELTAEDLLKLRRQTSDIATLIPQITKVTDKIATYSAVLSLETDVTKILSLYTVKRESETNVRTLSTVLDTLDNLVRDIEENTSILAATTTVDTLLRLYTERRTVDERCTGLLKTLSQLGRIRVSVDKAESAVTSLETTYTKTLKTLGICPLCGGKIKT
jgi:vacuolar-type H+-ATPase subunit I/STV1